MPMSQAFQERLFPKLPAIVEHFGTPFHIYDEVGIREGVRRLNELFGWNGGFREFFAVKALPNLRMMQILLREGCGFDCSSIPELEMARQIGTPPDYIMFTGNNTSQEEYRVALDDGGCILNLDDISFVEKVPDPFPHLICFRFNPGADREGNAIIGKPEEAKYGVRRDQLAGAYIEARNLRGATRFGLHTMVVSNERNYLQMVETVRMLLSLIDDLEQEIGEKFEFINIGGGIGIPYDPQQHKAFDIDSLAAAARGLFAEFERRNKSAPALFMESGRWVTGPHGVLVTTVLNRMEKHRKYVGVDACMSSLMRPGMYDAYHHTSFLEASGEERIALEGYNQHDIVGSLCENNDKFAVERSVPHDIAEGDLVVIHDTGAHGIAMGFQYNGRLRPSELLLREDGKVEKIRRAETTVDYLRTQVEFERDVLEV